MTRFMLGILLGIAIGIGLGKKQEMTPEQRKKIVLILVASFIIGVLVALLTQATISLNIQL